MLDEKGVVSIEEDGDVVDTPIDAPMIYFLRNSDMQKTGELLSRIEAAFNAREAGEYSDDIEFTRSVTERLSINDLCGEYDGLPYLSDDTAATMTDLLCIVIKQNIIQVMRKCSTHATSAHSSLTHLHRYVSSAHRAKLLVLSGYTSNS